MPRALSVLCLASLLLLAVAAAAAARSERAAASTPGVLRPEASLALPGEPGALLPLGSGVWVTQPDALVQVSKAADRITRRVRLPMTAYDLVAGAGSLWAVGMVAGQRRVTKDGNYPVILVARVDPRSGRLLARIPLPARSNGNRLAFVAGRLWITDPAEGPTSRIFTIDARTHRVGSFAGGQEPVALVAGGGRLWSANHDDGTLRAHDPKTGRTTKSTLLPGEPHGLAYASGRLWVADAHANRVLQVDPGSLEVLRRIPLGHESGPLAAAYRGGVWASGPWQQRGSLRLRRIDAAGRIVQALHAGAPVVDFESRDGTLWVAVTGANRLLRVVE